MPGGEKEPLSPVAALEQEPSRSAGPHVVTALKSRWCRLPGYAAKSNGVEQVCQRLLEHSTWRQSTALTVPSSLRSFETLLQGDLSSPTDWDPHESCYFCQERQDLMDQTDLLDPNSSFDHSPTKSTMPEELSEKTGGSLPLLPQEGMSSMGNQWQNGVASYPVWPMLPLFVTDQIARNSAALASLQLPVATSGVGLMDGFSCVRTPNEPALYAALGPETANDQPLDLSLKRKTLLRCRDVVDEEQPQKTVR
ncbi:hypothetical protein M513_13378 [Trichuris suis]|uniref:Uncharacterized protein n=1 Tax=Trichuris suis TaxID=68888 RepID=A0A085LLA3_9BILA|nr:hypothetical protein M513_13378 [Trichuris suis]